jgi:hypothetical protein
MKNNYLSRKWRELPYRLVLLSVLAALGGCQSQEPPLSPEARLFVEEVRETIAHLSVPLLKQITEKNIPAINAVLHKFYYEWKKTGRTLFRMNVLDHTGVVLTAYPRNPAIGQYFGQYTSVSRALQDKLISQERLLLASGAVIFSICAPVLEQDKVVGALGLILDPETAMKKWGITLEKFLAINFNR